MTSGDRETIMNRSNGDAFALKRQQHKREMTRVPAMNEIWRRTPLARTNIKPKPTVRNIGGVGAISQPIFDPTRVGFELQMADRHTARRIPSQGLISEGQSRSNGPHELHNLNGTWECLCDRLPNLSDEIFHIAVREVVLREFPKSPLFR